MSDLERNALTCFPCWPQPCPACGRDRFRADLVMSACGQMWICRWCREPTSEIGIIDPQAFRRRIEAEAILGRRIEPHESPSRIIHAAAITASARLTALIEGATR